MRQFRGALRIEQRHQISRARIPTRRADTRNRIQIFRQRSLVRGVRKLSEAIPQHLQGDVRGRVNGLQLQRVVALVRIEKRSELPAEIRSAENSERDSLEL